MKISALSFPVLLLVCTAMGQGLAGYDNRPASPAASVSVPGWLSNTEYSVGLLPTDVAVADFNHDGKPDLAVSSASGNGLNGEASVLFGNGDGTFQEQVSYTVGFNCESIAAGDLDGDGNLDLVVPCGFGSTVAVLLGNSDGSFRPQVTYATAGAPWGVVLGDFNGDGKPDVAVSTFSNVASVLLGNGDGTLQPHRDFGVGVGSTALTAGDFNGDGHLDLAVSNDNFGRTGDISVLLGVGDGTFLPEVRYTAGKQPEGLTATDLNHDGNLDLAVANYASGSVSVFMGNGDGTFAPQVTYAAGDGPTDVVAGDFNGDGILDLAVSDGFSSAPAATILIGNANGSFGRRMTFPGASGPAGLQAGDFNGDGKLDLAIADGFTSSVDVRLQTAAEISFTHLLFSSQKVGTQSAAKTLVLTNRGAVAMTISEVDCESTAFLVQSTCPATLAAGKSCGIKVSFTPNLAGLESSSLVITDSADSSPQVIGLAGKAVN